MLKYAQKEQFNQQGFVILKGFKNASQIEALKARALEIACAHNPDAHREVFSTDREKGPQADKIQDYFLSSANDIKCFFEDGAFDENGQLVRDLAQCINKIGHAMHDLDKVFEDFSHGEQLAELAKDVGLAKPQIWQSMYIFKQPHIGGKVDWHQDTGFFMTTPQSVTTFWFAIDDATLENGCLWVEPGGHKGPLRQRFVRAGRKTQIIELDPTPWPDETRAIPLQVKAGTLLVFNGLLPHYSAANMSDRPRNAYTLHVTDGSCAYAPENWIQRGKDFPVSGFV